MSLRHRRWFFVILGIAVFLLLLSFVLQARSIWSRSIRRMESLDATLSSNVAMNVKNVCHRQIVPPVVPFNKTKHEDYGGRYSEIERLCPNSLLAVPRECDFHAVLTNIETEELPWRFGCGLESFARFHPNHRVCFHIRRKSRLHMKKFEELFAPYPNIIVKRDVESSFEGTPMEDWFLDLRYNESFEPLVHLADAARQAIVYKYGGGVYFDLDLVAIRPLDCLYEEDTLVKSFPGSHPDFANGILISRNGKDGVIGGMVNRIPSKWDSSQDEKKARGLIGGTLVYEVFYSLEEKYQKKCLLLAAQSWWPLKAVVSDPDLEYYLSSMRPGGKGEKWWRETIGSGSAMGVHFSVGLESFHFIDKLVSEDTLFAHIFRYSCPVFYKHAVIPLLHTYPW